LSVAGGGGILRYFARHQTAANLLLVLLVVAGLLAASRMRAQYFPDVVVAEVNVTVAWPGAGAEDVDRGIVQLLEPVLLAINGVVTTEARTAEGSTRISVEFEPGTDLDRAAADVENAVTQVRNLPEGADAPEVRRTLWRDQVTDVVITGPVGVDQLARFADEFSARLFAAGITRTTIQGLAAPGLVIEVPSVALIRHDITMAEIASAIGAAARSAPAGEVGDGSARLRTGGEARGAAEIGAVVLKARPEGGALTVADVGEVITRGVDSGRRTFVGDNPAITLRVDRNETGDAIRIQALVAEVAGTMQAGLPPGVTVDLVRTRAEQISDRLTLLFDNGIMGLCLVVVLLFLFLNARIALWVAAGIPVAMLGALAAMYAAGLTINMISLFALIIMLGIVVDDAIVVGEHADFRARVLKESPQVAAEGGANQMVAPVFASSITTIVAFLGLVAIGGRFGEIIADIPWTVTFVLLASLVECFLILPNHLVHALVAAEKDRWYDWPSRQVNRGMAWFQTRVIRPAMRGVITWRYPVLATAVLALAAQGALFLRGDVQFRFFNAPEQTTVTGNFVMLPGAGRDDTFAMMRELQRATEKVAQDLAAEHGLNPVEYVLAETGGAAGRGLASADETDPDLLGGISIELVNPDLRPYSSSAFVTALQAEVRPHPLLEELSFRGSRYGPGGDSLAVDLSGASSEQLNGAAEALKAALAVYPEVSALEDSLSLGKEELILSLTPQGQALGFEVDALGRSLRDRLSGIEAASFPEGPRTATIRVELPDRELTADFLDRTLMRTAAGDYVPLADLVTVERRDGFSTVRRENGLQVVTVTGDLSEDDPVRASDVQRALKDEILPRIAADFGVELRLSGQAAQEAAFFSDTGVALIACLVGIYLTLAWIFGQWLRPLVVMTVIPFGLVGAVFGHWHWDVPLSLFSIVGLIGMSGIIINDAIVLVTTIDDYARTRSLRAAIVDGVADRFRAVLLTTLTTVLGLAPLLFEGSSQAEFLKPTVITLSYGLGFGMVLVLLVVPAIIVVQEDLGRSVRALRRGLTGAPREMRLGLQWAVIAMFALFAAAPGWFAVTGAGPGWVSALWPAAAETGALGQVLGIFALGAVLIVGLYSLLSLRAMRSGAARRLTAARYGLDAEGAET